MKSKCPVCKSDKQIFSVSYLIDSGSKSSSSKSKTESTTTEFLHIIPKETTSGTISTETQEISHLAGKLTGPQDPSVSGVLYAFLLAATMPTYTLVTTGFNFAAAFGTAIGVAFTFLWVPALIIGLILGAIRNKFEPYKTRIKIWKEQTESYKKAQFCATCGSVFLGDLSGSPEEFKAQHFKGAF